MHLRCIIPSLVDVCVLYVALIPAMTLPAWNFVLAKRIVSLAPCRVSITMRSYQVD